MKNESNPCLGHKTYCHSPFFLEVVIITEEMFNESQLYLRSEQNLKWTKLENNNELDLRG